MTLLQLEYFRVLAHSQQLNETANQMYVSASTVSTSIRNLEGELGVTLFERPGRNIRLNEQGKLFLSYVEKVFELIDEGKQAVEAIHRDYTKTIVVAVPNTLKLGSVFGKYLLNDPTVEIKNRRYTCIQDELEKAEVCDFFITVEDLHKLHMFDCRPLVRVPIRLVVRKDNPLAKREMCSLEELAEETFIFRPKNDCFQQQICSILKECGFKPKKTHTFDEATCSKMVKKGVGVTIDIDKQKAMTRHAECPLTTVKIREFEENEKGAFVICGYWDKGQGLSEESSDLLDMVNVALRNYYLHEGEHELPFVDLETGRCTI